MNKVDDIIEMVRIRKFLLNNKKYILIFIIVIKKLNGIILFF